MYSLCAIIIPNSINYPIYLIDSLTPPVASASGVLVCAVASGYLPEVHDAFAFPTFAIRLAVWLYAGEELQSPRVEQGTGTCSTLHPDKEVDDD